MTNRGDQTLAAPELSLVSLVGFHLEPDVVRKDLDALGAPLEVRQGRAGFRAGRGRIALS